MSFHLKGKRDPLLSKGLKHSPSLAMNLNRKQLWQKFRAQVVELDGYKCIRCGRSQDDGAVLHVHHKSYIVGQHYWDYPAEMMETLCAGCHAKEHGIISPDCGWVLSSDSDLGARIGACDYCGNSLRYTFHITHPNWPSMDVGSDCCNQLTRTDIATALERRRQTRDARRQRFVESGGWHYDDEEGGGNGTFSKFDLRYRILLQREPGGYRIRVGPHRGQHIHQSIADAKAAAFDAVEWLEKRRIYGAMASA
jgi:hypothetical protein